MTEFTQNNADFKLPGYQLREMLGAGGYGEVWLADAPGGLTKAVKIIFGFHNEKRAALELKSLEKIKAVRHPFLLSLERIEVIDGRLVVVTELADGSLKDRFDHYRNEGKAGIPRDELLGYLRDSADALDYLSDQHSLQHLDIKPENLLLVAGHVKVADFGLVKEIQDTQASLIGGMTPLYSAPEVFQGIPTRFSDQYSLAVLYQEMLTGQLPFHGTNSAELTLQHMHDEPDLSPLPQADRYLLARALSKRPEQRYPSCSELVEALLKANQHTGSSGSEWDTNPTSQKTTPSSNMEKLRKSRPGTVTQVFEDNLIDDPSDVSESMLMDLPEVLEEALQSVPPLDLQDTHSDAVPTLVIGIGGTGGHVLTQIRQRLSKKYGANDAVPSLQLLLLDTDKDALLQASHGSKDSVLSAEETLALQLRRPQDYRDHMQRINGWLSRRWLYNIPKSLQTEGLRPLGRLAFSDHARQVLQRIRLALTQTMDESSVEESSTNTGLQFCQQKVRVYVVASISGGTGSGISIDIGYAVRGLLDKLGIKNATTTGLLMHSTGRDAQYCDLSKVNAYSWLKEYSHFAGPHGSYPGDQSIGLPAMPAGTPVFDNTYFLKLGDGLSPKQLKEKTGAVAQYLLLDSLSSARTFFDASRDASPSLITGQPVVRTFGLSEKEPIAQTTLDSVAHQVCQRVVLGWSGTMVDAETRHQSNDTHALGEQETASVSDTNQLVAGAPHAVASLQLNLEGISANAREIIEAQFGADNDEVMSRIMDNLSDTQNVTLAAVIKQIDTQFSPREGADSKHGRYVQGRPLDAIISPLGMKLAADLQRWLIKRLDEGQERLAGTRQAAEWFTDHLLRVENDSHRLVRAIGSKLLALANEFGEVSNQGTNQTPHHTADQIQEIALRYYRLRLDLSALYATSHLVRMLQSELKSLREAIVEFGRHLRHLADKLVTPQDDNRTIADSSNLFTTEDPVESSLLASLPLLTEVVDRRVQEQFIDTQGGLFQTVMGSRKVISSLLDTLRSIAAEEVANVSQATLRSSDHTHDVASLKQHVTQSRPSMLDLGGSASQLFVLPQNHTSEEAAASLRAAVNVEASILTGAESNFVVCTEVAGIPLARIAVDLIECRRDYADFAERVHTRSDIPWSPLVESKPAMVGIGNSSICATQVLN